MRALQGLAPERVVQIGTVSKTLAPALRLGWLVAPREVAHEAARLKRLLDDFSPALDQLALVDFLASGRYHRHLRRARATYARRRDALRAALAAHMPDAVVGVSAGLHLLLRLPDDVDDTETARDLLAARYASHRFPSCTWAHPATTGSSSATPGSTRRRPTASCGSSRECLVRDQLCEPVVAAWSACSDAQRVAVRGHDRDVAVMVRLLTRR